MVSLMNDFRLWECLVCGFIYDEAKGWPEDGIAPGTRWEDVPEDWLCPECGVGKADFEMMDIGPSPSTAEKPSSAPAPEKQENAQITPVASEAATQQWQCHECGFIYSEQAGWQEDGIAPGSRWQGIADDWSCPDCGAEKSAFAPLMAESQASEPKDKGIVIIGTGLAAYNLVRELRKHNPELVITMLTADDGHFYSKPQLSTGYSKQKRADELVTSCAEQMAHSLNIDLRIFTRVTEINTQAQFVVANGQRFDYAKLVLAWGASCIVPPMQGSGLSEVYQINDLLDYSRFRTAMAGKRRVLIIGAGLIGSEYANDLAQAGFAVDAVDPLTGPLATLLPEAASQAVQTGLETLGVRYHFGTVVERIEQHGRGVRAQLANGDTLDADIVLSAVGVRPRTELAQTAGIETNRGIVTNRFLETSAPDVYALGDCAEVAGHVLYYVAPLLACARSLAATLSGTPTQVFYGAMPVKVKTPACPLTVLPPPMGLEGNWTIEQQGLDTKALFHDEHRALRGFALTGTMTSEANNLASMIPALLK